MITLVTLDTALSLALSCFAVSLPFSVISIAIDYFSLQFKYDLQGSDEFCTAVLIIPAIGVPVGIASIFWHFDYRIGILFIASSLASIILFTIWDTKIKIVNRNIE
jgi:hypothetical protein